MTTLAEATTEAPRHAQAQRFAAMKLLRVDEGKAQPEDMALIEKVRAITKPDDWDNALAGSNVAELFRRGVLFFDQSGTANKE